MTESQHFSTDRLLRVRRAHSYPVFCDICRMSVPCIMTMLISRYLIAEALCEAVWNRTYQEDPSHYDQVFTNWKLAAGKWVDPGKVGP